MEHAITWGVDPKWLNNESAKEEKTEHHQMNQRLQELHHKRSLELQDSDGDQSEARPYAQCRAWKPFDVPKPNRA